MIERFLRKNITSLNHHLTMGFLESKGIYPSEDESIVITNFLKENLDLLNAIVKTAKVWLYKKPYDMFKAQLVQIGTDENVLK